MEIDRLMIDYGDNVFYTKKFMDVLEAHMPYLRTSSKTLKITVDLNDAYIYDSDFFGYLNKRNIQVKYHWIFMRVNNFYSPMEFNPDILSLLVPNEQEISQIRNTYSSSGLINF